MQVFDLHSKHSTPILRFSLSLFEYPSRSLILAMACSRDSAGNRLKIGEVAGKYGYRNRSMILSA